MRKAFVFFLAALVLTLFTAAASAGEWVDDYILSTGADTITVDFEDYYNEHPGDYYVCYVISGNPYFSWHKCVDESSYAFPAAPGLKYEVKLWYDEERTGDSPNWAKENVRKTRIPSPGAMDDFPYTLKTSSVGVRDKDTNQFTNYDVIPLSVMDHDNLEIRYRWAWDFEVEKEDEFSMLLKLTGPEGTIFVLRSNWTISPEDASYNYWQQNMKNLMAEHTRRSDSQLEGEFELEVFINGKTFDALSFRMGYVEDTAADEPAPPAEENEPEQPEPTLPPAPSADIVGLWKHVSTKIMGVEVDNDTIPTQMYYDFHDDGTVTVTTIGENGEASVVTNDWRMEGDQVLVSDVELMYLEDEYLVIDMMGVSTLYFERTDEPVPGADEDEPEPDTEPEPTPPPAQQNGEQLPPTVNAADEKDFFGTWKLTRLQYNGSFRKSNAVRTYEITEGQAKEITLTGTSIYPTEFRNGQLIMLVDDGNGGQLEMPFFLLTDGNIAQDVSAFYGAGVIIYCEKQ